MRENSFEDYLREHLMAGRCMAYVLRDLQHKLKLTPVSARAHYKQKGGFSRTRHALERINDSWYDRQRREMHRLLRFTAYYALANKEACHEWLTNMCGKEGDTGELPGLLIKLAEKRQHDPEMETVWQQVLTREAKEWSLRNRERCADPTGLPMHELQHVIFNVSLQTVLLAGQSTWFDIEGRVTTMKEWTAISPLTGWEFHPTPSEHARWCCATCGVPQSTGVLVHENWSHAVGFLGAADVSERARKGRILFRIAKQKNLKKGARKRFEHQWWQHVQAIVAVYLRIHKNLQCEHLSSLSLQYVFRPFL
jgi:hypothetical protein